MYFTNQKLMQRKETPWNWILRVLKWIIPMDRAQRADDNSGVICLFIMFTPRFTVFKMSKFTICLYFLLLAAKVWERYLSTHGRYYRVCAGNDMVYRFWPKCSWDIVDRYKKIAESRKKYQNPVFWNVEIFLMAAENYIIHSIF